MSGSQPGFLTILGGFVGDLWQYSAIARERKQQEKLQKQAMRDARVAERESRAQQERWLEIVQQQNARGNAGDAEEADAVDALRGSGGRRSNLDDRWF